MTDEPAASCEVCHGESLLDVLDIWSIQREYMNHGAVGFDGIDGLPMIKKAIRCPACHGTEATDEDMRAIEKRMGGSPWDLSTFQPFAKETQSQEHKHEH